MKKRNSSSYMSATPMLAYNEHPSTKRRHDLASGNQGIKLFESFMKDAGMLLAQPQQHNISNQRHNRGVNKQLGEKPRLLLLLDVEWQDIRRGQQDEGKKAVANSGSSPGMRRWMAKSVSAPNPSTKEVRTTM